ncbi:site-specific DNA-methyltransferase [Castellaniella sp.]|uniref:site-specific DNA-methyltransferase n=1 Tax=Castellaniella sp. TaxID=1955812 RepID=UPI002AFEA5A1|nr:site-specific DNA-methyltransferase [Castellaniella sp.]
MQIESLPLDRLVPYARNSRTHSDAQVSQIMASIREFGFTNPILIDADGGVIAGHGRILAATRLGMKEVPCLRLGHLTEAQKRAYVIADNKLALNAGWDETMLAAELRDLADMDYDLGLTGFADDEIKVLLAELDAAPTGATDPNAVPPVPDVPVSRPGDVWVLGRHRVMCGSSTDPAAWARLMRDDRADICVTDPPYNVAYEGKTKDRLTIQNDSMSAGDFRQFLLEFYRAVFDVMKPGAPIYVYHADTEGLNFRSAFIEAGFKLSGCLVWRKNTMVLGRSDYQWMHEPILYGWKPGAAHRWYGGRKLTTIIEHGEGGAVRRLDDGRWAVQAGDDLLIVDASATLEQHLGSVIYHDKPARNGEHPTMKPVSLIERNLRASSRAGDIAIDGFGGSGSTLMAADRLGQSARLMELDGGYVDVIVRRWQDYSGGGAHLEGDGASFDEVAERRGADAAVERLGRNVPARSTTVPPSAAV